MGSGCHGCVRGEWWLKGWLCVRMRVGHGVVGPCMPLRIIPRTLVVEPRRGIVPNRMVCMAKSAATTTDEKVKKGEKVKQAQKKKDRAEEAITPQSEDYSR